jgi:hypothetical protein
MMEDYRIGELGGDEKIVSEGELDLGSHGLHCVVPNQK